MEVQDRQGSGGGTPSREHDGNPVRGRAPDLMFYPAIDLKEGNCVRLRQGEMQSAVVYAEDPATQAKSFEHAGCQYLHIVDLDGAFAGRPVNREAVEAIVAAVRIPVQLGGGIRDRATIEAWLAGGVARVLLGSAAVKNPALVREAARAHPGRVAVGIDARDGMVATEGWVDRSTIDASELAVRMQDAGAAAIVFTEIARDGTLEGLDLDATARIADAVSIPVIASGGIGSLDHLRALRETALHHPAIRGVIVGRALYDGRVAIPDILHLFAC